MRPCLQVMPGVTLAQQRAGLGDGATESSVRLRFETLPEMRHRANNEATTWTGDRVSRHM